MVPSGGLEPGTGTRAPRCVYQGLSEVSLFKLTKDSDILDSGYFYISV